MSKKTIEIAEFAHDITTPAMNIIGFSELLLCGEFGKLTQEQKGYVSDIMMEAKKLKGVAQKLREQ